MPSTGGTLVHVNPILNVSDLQASITFYTELLDTFGDPANFAIIRWDNYEIYLCQNAQGHPGTWLALFVTNHAALHTHLSTNNANLTPYTPNTEFHLTDPDNHVLRIFPATPEN